MKSCPFCSSQAIIFKKKVQEFECVVCEKRFIHPKENETKQQPPPLHEQFQSFGSSIFNFAKSGLPFVEEHELEKRLKVCGNCEKWNPLGFNGTGKCNECGCSTWAKLRMATESCPLGKWTAAPLKTEN